MIFSSFNDAKLMARLASYVTGVVTFIKRVPGKESWSIDNKMLNDYIDDDINGGRPAFDYPEIAAFWLLDGINEAEMRNSWFKFELKGVEALRVKILNLIKLDIEEKKLGVNSYYEEEWRKEEKTRKLEEEEELAQEEFEKNMSRWNPCRDSDEHGYWNGYDWIYTKEDGDGDDLSFGWPSHP